MSPWPCCQVASKATALCDANLGWDLPDSALSLWLARVVWLCPSRWPLKPLYSCVPSGVSLHPASDSAKLGKRLLRWAANWAKLAAPPVAFSPLLSP